MRRPAAARRARAARIEELLDDRVLVVRTGAAGRARVLERFTWPAIADQMVEL